MQAASTVDNPARPRATAYNPQSDIIRPRHLPQAVGLTETTIWRYRQRGEFPEPIELGPQAVGWRRADIEQWLASRRRKNESAQTRGSGAGR